MNLLSNKLLNLLKYQQESPLLFNSGLFLFLFLGFLLIYNLVQRNSALKIIWVVIFSLYFYYKSSGWYVLLLLATSAFAHYITIYIYKERKIVVKKLLLTISLVVYLGMLGWFKYAHFIADIIYKFTHQTLAIPILLLPLGISFYTFELISYSVDAYRGLFKPVKKLRDFFFYISFFPHLVAGPIVRPKELLPQLYSDYKLSRTDVGRAVFLIMCGLFKKGVISDYISSNFVDRIFDNPTLYSGLENLLGVYGYTLQIYCDFSGYSDMALGIALLLGFHLPLNFLAPYRALSLTDFWRRWHISLSSWLRDYLYIPLGGNRVPAWRQMVNLFITMLLGGLWHGAAWKFVLWGSVHGAWLVLEKLFSMLIPLPQHWIKKVLGWVITFHVVSACWILFRAANLDGAIEICFQIFNNFQPQLFAQILTAYSPVLLLIGIGFVLHAMPPIVDEWVQLQVIKSPLILKSILLTIIIWIVIQTKSAEVQPFIYFQF